MNVLLPFCFFSERGTIKEEAEIKSMVNNQAESTKVYDADNSSSTRKLYRCLYCNLTDSDAYLLLVHQMKSHPGEFIVISQEHTIICILFKKKKTHTKKKFSRKIIEVQ